MVKLKDLKDLIHNYMESNFGNDIEEYGKIEQQYYYHYWWVVKKDGKYRKLELFYNKVNNKLGNFWSISQVQVDMYGIMVDHSARNISETPDSLSFTNGKFPVFDLPFMRKLYEEICDFYDKEEIKNEYSYSE